MKRVAKAPILEFDDNRIAKINPDIVASEAKEFGLPKLPDKLVITFFHDVIKRLLADNEIEQLFILPGENPFPIYKFKKYNVLIHEGRLGGPASGGYLEDMYGLGVKKVMFCGGGGALRPDLSVGKLIIPTSAIRDEGFSYHYFKPSRYINADKRVVNKICKYLDKQELEYITGRVWTTDAFFRETQERINRRIEEGALLVEMEQAAMFSVAKFRDIKYGAIIYAGDDLTKDEWDKRGWSSREDIRYDLVKICLNIVRKM